MKNRVLDKFTVKVDNVEKDPVLIDGVLTITVPSAISGSTYKFTFVDNKMAPDGKYLFNHNLMWDTGYSTKDVYTGWSKCNSRNPKSGLAHCSINRTRILYPAK